MTTRRDVGLILLWIGIVYMVLTLAEIRETAWAINQPLFWLWAFSVPLGSILAGLGLLLRAGSKGSHIWVFGIGMVLALMLMQFVPTGTHHPPVFGVVGGIILALFLLTVWFWAKSRANLQGPTKTAGEPGPGHRVPRTRLAVSLPRPVHGSEAGRRGRNAVDDEN
jgi:hypothetical protein